MSVFLRLSNIHKNEPHVFSVSGVGPNMYCLE